MLPRILEPEVMDTPAEARDYNAMDHGEVNRRFVDDLFAAVSFASDDPASGFRRLGHPPHALDVGTGTALIPLELCRRGIPCRITAIDLAGEMLELARRNVADAGHGESIALEWVDAKSLPYETGRFDVVMSNSIIHHIPEPAAALAEMLRVLRPGGLLLVRDLLRPDDRPTLEHLVETYAGRENEHQQAMFRDSLHAALTLEEVRRLAIPLGLSPDTAQQTTDRHWTLTVQNAVG